MKRNWKWLIPLICLAVLVGIGGFAALFVGVNTIVKSSDAYSGAVVRAKSSPAVIAALGTPIKEGFGFNGKIYEGNGSGNADLTIPISGPKGTAKIYVTATRSLGQWHFDELVVRVDKTQERINLSETNGLSAEMPDSSPKKP